MEKAFETVGVTIDGYVLSPLASGEVVLTETEREMGVIVCDIGGGTCDLAIYIEGVVWHTAVLPVGGDHLTSDIAQGLHLPPETAEQVKTAATGMPGRRCSTPNEVFAVRPFGEEKPVQIRRVDLAAIIEPRGRRDLRPGAAGDQALGLRRPAAGRDGAHRRDQSAARDPRSGREVLDLPVRVGQPGGAARAGRSTAFPGLFDQRGPADWARLQEEQSRLDGRGGGLASRHSISLAPPIS